MTVNRACFIHIGMHKTGSSSIQNSLFAVGDLGPVYYADISGVANHGGAMIDIFSKRPDRNHANIKRGLTMAQIQERRARFITGLSRTIAAQPCKDLLISGEGISLLEEDELQAMRAMLAESFRDIRIIGYVRGPKSYMESAFQEKVKGTAARLAPEELHPHYRNLFEKFDRVFGRENVLLRKFDPAQFPQGCVVRDFCRILNVVIRDEQVERVNESLSRDAVSILFAYRKYGPGYGVGAGVMMENRRLVNALVILKGAKLRFSDSLVEGVLHKHASDIRWMEDRLGASLQEPSEVSASAVASEAELLDIPPAAVGILRSLIRPEYCPVGVTGESAEEVAQLVHALRRQLAESGKGTTQAGQTEKVRTESIDVSVQDLLLAASEGAPSGDRLSEVPAAIAKELVLAVFRQVVEQLEAREDGALSIARLGKFLVHRRDLGEGKQGARVVRFLPEKVGSAE